MMKNLFLVFVLLAVAQSIFYKEHPLAEKDQNDQGVEQWFDQLLDHTFPNSKTTWKQRFFVYDKYFDHNNGTVILYICGEWTCEGLGSATFALNLAERYNAIVFALEHRFFGASQPMGYGENSYSTQSFEKYLNVHQALDDLAYFITIIKNNGEYGVKQNTPWITMGGSYPGALSAWFRYKYPHLTVAALASSGVVSAKLDYFEYDQQVEQSTAKSGDYCPNIISKVTKIADLLVDNPIYRDTFMNQFGAKGLSDGEFFYFFADITAGFIQGGRRIQLCEMLQNKTTSEGLDVMLNLSKMLDVNGYKTEYLKNTTYDKNNNARQWFFQTCSELGYWQTQGTSLRSKKVNIQFYNQWCQDVFGKSSEGSNYWANVNVTNGYFGGDNLNVRNLIMTNGGEDPWKHASIYQQRNNSDVNIIHIDCNNCAHCSDTKGPKETDPQELKDARSQIISLFDKWIGEFKLSQQ